MTAILSAALAALSLALAVPAQAAEQSPFRDLVSAQPQGIEAYAGDGRWLVVMIWAHDCHVCNVEAEGYAQFHEAHKEQDAQVLGISLDGAAKQAEAQAFVERHALPFPNLIGEPGAVMRHYAMLTGENFIGTPTILLYGPDGQLLAAQAGAVPVESIEAYMARHATRPAASG